MSETEKGPTQDNRPISISTPLGKDVLLLVSFHFQEKLGVPFSMEMKLQSTDANIKFADIIGQNVTVTVMTSNKTPRYFNGFVSHFSQTGFEEAEGGELANYRAVMVPWIWMLGKTSCCRIFENQTVPEIVEGVFKANGFSEISSKLTSHYEQIPFCVQYDETDLAFVSRLMEWQGISYFSDSSQLENTLVLCDANTEPLEFPGYGTVYYNPQSHGPHMAEHIYEWIIEQDVQTGEVTLEDFNYTQPRLNLQETSKSKQTYPNGQFQRYAYPGYYSKESEGEKLAAVRLQALAAAADTRRGSSNVLGLAVGYKFELKSYPRTDQNTSYLVSEVDLEVITASFATSSESSLIFHVTCGFRALETTIKFCPPRRTPKPRMGGPQTAMVIGPSESSPETDSYGNVRVQFHWGLDDKENQSCMVRVSQNSSGDSWGSMFIPHPGTEVVVDFEDGDPDRPLVTGRVYNADQMPPKDPKTNPQLSYIEDSSQKNLIQMDATKGKEELLVLNGNNSLRMNSTEGADGINLTDGKSWIIFDTPKGNIEMEVQNAHKSHVTGNATSIVEGAQTLVTLGILTTTTAVSNLGLFGGLYYELVVGAKVSMLVGLDVDIHANWKYEKYKEKVLGRAEQTPVVVEEHDQVLVRGQEEIRQLTGALTERIGTVEQLVEGAVSVQAANSEEILEGSKDISAQAISLICDEEFQVGAGGDVTVVGTDVNISAIANFVVDAAIIEMG